MNNTPRNNIRLEIDELEALVGILNTYIDRQPSVVLDDEKLAKISNRLRWLLFKERAKRDRLPVR
jgi:hypothetical protein